MSEQVLAPVEAPDPFNGGSPSFEEFSKYRQDGTVPERFKAEEKIDPPAAAEKPAETVPVQEAGETEQDTQEKGKRVEFTPEQQEAFDRAFRKREAKLRREFEQKYATKTSEPQATSAEKTETVATDPSKRPEPPKLSTYKGTVEDYEKDLADYPAKLQAFLDAERQVKDRQSAVEKKLTNSEAKAIKAHLDYKDEVGALYDDIKSDAEPKLPPHVLKAVAEESEDPHELTYYLAKNREEFRRLASLTPAETLREVLRLDFKIANAPAPTKEAPKKDKPKPPEPVAGRQVSTAFDVNDEKTDPDEWAIRRNKQVAERRNR